MRRLPILLALLLSTGSLSAAVPYQVADLRTKPELAVWSQPLFLGTANNVVFFAARVNQGQELWRSDGTAGGTFSLTRFAAANEPFPKLTSGNLLWFTTFDATGAKLWKSDGTAAGTVVVAPAGPSLAVPLAVLGKNVITRQQFNTELWVFDGTSSRRIATLASKSTQWSEATVLGGNAYIATEGGLWKSDGTESGTTQLVSTAVWAPTAVGDKVYFAASAPGSGGELWVTDGTSAGTHLVTDLLPTGSTFSHLTSAITSLGARVLFLGSNGEFGVSDGTAGGTQVLRKGNVLKTVLPQFAVLGSVAYFTFDDGEHGLQLWKSDGTAGGTQLVHAMAAAAPRVNGLRAGATRIYYFGGDDLVFDTELYESDGTDAGTHRVLDPPTAAWQGSAGSLQAIATIGDTAFFSTDDGAHGTEPWVTDGSAAGTHLLRNIGEEAAGRSSPYNFVAGADRLFFKAQGDGGWNLWSSDGTAGGTVPINNALTSPDGVKLFGAVGNTLYFQSFGQQKTQIRKSGDLPGSSLVLKEFDSSSTGTPYPDSGFVSGGRFYLSARSVFAGQLSTTDSSGQGLAVVFTIPFSGVGGLTALAGNTYFFAGNPMGLYATDGTAEGSHRVATVEANSMVPPTPFGGSLFLLGEVQSFNESRLWRFSDAPPRLDVVKHFPGNFNGGGIAAAAGPLLFFSWRDASRHDQLWRSDGTEAGTTLVRDFPSALPSNLSTLAELVALPDGRVVFQVDDGVHGIEPWVSDGTAAGTILLRDINPSGSSSPVGFKTVDGILYFAADDGVHGVELWQSDGTAEGTQLAADIEPGSGGSEPFELTVAGDLLFFAATTTAAGRELWALPLSNASITIDDARAKESAGKVSLPVRLSRSSRQRVSVAYATADGTAAAGHDYTAASGTVTFEPGETVKTIDIPIADDAAPGAARAFFVKLSNANAPLQRAAASALIDDDDARVDLALSLAPGFSSPAVSVRNNGPSRATNVTLCTASLPSDSAFNCGTTPFELAAGESHSGLTSGTSTILARVTSWEPESNPADNRAIWGQAGSPGSILVASPPNPRAGTSGTLTISQAPSAAAVVVTLASSDPTVIQISPTLTIPANTSPASIPFTALKTGVSTISATTQLYGTQNIQLQVNAPTGPLRYRPFVDLAGFTGRSFGQSNDLQVTVRGLTLDGTLPGGSVTLFQDGSPLGTLQLTNQTARLTVSGALPGTHNYSATYGGDANFFAADSNPLQDFVRPGTPVFTATAIAGTGNVRIVVHGVAGHAPGGTIAVFDSSGAHSLTAPLARLDDANASAVATGFAPTARTVTINYSGDGVYDVLNATIPITAEHRRAGGR